ncbi:MAG: hypothetical protein BGO12_20515 [Verrucomicrobia bacterium 61-8]|nr:MAG: hypothetical protein BGO12_20515 [Verrucomicrobia bacterium 61-8]
MPGLHRFTKFNENFAHRAVEAWCDLCNLLREWLDLGHQLDTWLQFNNCRLHCFDAKISDSCVA